MQSNVRFRRKYFINKAFQVNFIMRFVGLVIFGSIISGLVLYFYMAHQLDNGPEVMYHNTMAVLTPAIVFTQFIVGIFIISITTYVVLLLSHRIAGPLYRLERVAERVGEGDLTVRITFRDKDALLPFKTSFQNMIDNLQCRMLRMQDNVSELRNFEREFQETIKDSAMPPEEKERIQVAFSEFTDRYEKSLREFKLPAAKPHGEVKIFG